MKTSRTTSHVKSRRLPSGNWSAICALGYFGRPS
jgi:hypothetical protein